MQMICCVNATPESTNALQTALQWKKPNDKLTLLHVVCVSLFTLPTLHMTAVYMIYVYVMYNVEGGVDLADICWYGR